MPSAAHTASPPLSIAEAREVMRYWREALRAEEALQTRPRARKVEARAEPPRLDLPTPGQDYFKLSADGALDALLFEGSSLERPLAAELSAYFETWLYNQYRRSEGDVDAPHLACFPAVHLARGELAGLLRAQVRLVFQTGTGDNFRVPSRQERARGRLPEPPIKALLLPVQRVEGALPLFVDTRLLNRTFAVAHERIDAFFDALRAREEPSERDMVVALAQLLEEGEDALAGRERGEAGRERGEAKGAREEADPLRRLTRAAARRLVRVGARAEAYGVAIVVDGSAAKTTWYLQQELKTLLADEDAAALAPGMPLHSYLTHTPSKPGISLQYGRFPGPPLSAVQARVVTRFWGSPFSAVQGPPGTGKTTLILHLCAEALVRSIAALADQGAPSVRPFVVASSNNRAVDNVLTPLAELAGQGFPLALRAGSRQVMADELLPTLGRARQLLHHAKSRPRDERIAAMKSALYAYVAVRHRLRDVLAPQENAHKRVAARADIRDELARLPAARAMSTRAEALSSAERVVLNALADALRGMETRLEALASLCAEDASENALKRLRMHFQRTQKRAALALESALAAAGVACTLGLPPALVAGCSTEAAVSAWENALEGALDTLALLATDVADAVYERGRRGTTQRLTEQLRALEADEAESSASPSVESALSEHDAGLALFQAAVAAREAWANAHAEALEDALDGALASLNEERSLRPFLREGSTRARLFLQLFGVWGCTLLSFGNVFPPDVASIAELVIDEAGQCHPAHAISGLLRAQRALVIGDVHQLAPVLELSRDDDARLRYSLRLAIDSAKIAPFLLHNQGDGSLQSVADRAVHERLTLIDHYRCQPEIIALSDVLCSYGLTVHTACARRHELSRILPGPVLFLDILGQQEELGGSYHNEAELSATVALLARILSAGVDASDVAIITPYRGQLERLQRACIARGVPLEHSAELREAERFGGAARRGLALGTVHRFQGGERSVVLFTSVVSDARSLPFLNARPNLLNVAISRARHHFVAVGRHAILAQGARTRILTERASLMRERLPPETTLDG